MKKLTPWLGAIAILVIIFGTLYGVVVQDQRTAANYPQVQLAEDTAASLDAGSKENGLITGHININDSLAPFTIIYTKSGQVVSGNGYLNGRIPAAPIGILQHASGKDYHWISWQPAGNVRIAAVTVQANNYYVLSGRSLKEVEKNENVTFEMSFAGGLASLIVLGCVYVVWYRAK